MSNVSPLLVNPTTQEQVSNIQTVRKALLTEVGKLGALEGKGAKSRVSLAVKVAQAAQDEIIGTAQAQEIWREFMREKNESAKSIGGAAVDGNQSSEKQQVAKLNAFIKAGIEATSNGYDFAGDVLLRAQSVVHGEAFKDLKMSSFDRLLQVARAQLDENNKLAALTDDQIASALSPKPTEEKDEEATLEALLQSMRKVHDGKTNKDGEQVSPAFPSQELADAIATVEARLANIQAFKANLKAQAKSAAIAKSSVPTLAAAAQ